MIVKQDIVHIMLDACKNVGYEIAENDIKFSAMQEIADFQFNNCFKIAKEKGVNPFEIATSIVNGIKPNKNFSFSVSKPAFINIKLTNEGCNYYANLINSSKDLCVDKVEKSKTIFMDYGGANIAKDLHMGHLRSPIIGEGLRRLNILKGNTVFSDVHFGDFGLQMGLTIAQLEEDGYLDFYFKGAKEKATITLDLLNEEYPKASGRKNDATFKQKADDYTLKLQQKMDPYYSAYLDIKSVSMKEIIKYYGLLNTHFDYLKGESDVSDTIEKVVNIFVDKNLAYTSEGALVCDVAIEGEHIPIPKENENEVQRYKNPMPPILLKKRNGGDLYAITDIATIYERNKLCKPDEIIYVVDKRQQTHFTQVFRACKKAGISNEKQILTFVGFGTMNGKDGKPFKTRSGETIKLKDIYNLVVEKAQEKLSANGIENNAELARQIGVSALKFGDLSNTVSKDYILDIDKFLSFEGKTGPYIQYNGARINSILNKANLNLENKHITINTNEEKNLIISILKQIESYNICVNENSLNALCTSLYETANAFAQLYNNINILKAESTRKESLVCLCSLTLKVLTQGLNVLAIDMPEKM